MREKKAKRTESRLYKELLAADNSKERWTRDLKALLQKRGYGLNYAPLPQFIC